MVDTYTLSEQTECFTSFRTIQLVLLSLCIAQCQQLINPMFVHHFLFFCAVDLFLQKKINNPVMKLRLNRSTKHSTCFLYQENEDINIKVIEVIHHLD